MRLGIVGGTGFIGRGLCHAALAAQHDVVVFSRRLYDAKAAVPTRVQCVEWKVPESGVWEEELARCDAIVNLAGHNLFEDRWNEDVLEKIRMSRIETAGALAAAIGRVRTRPKVLVNASAIGYYGPTGDEELDETAPAGGGERRDPKTGQVLPPTPAERLARLCVEWEEAARPVEQHGVRLVLLRIGVVLGVEGGALPQMVPPFKFFAGGPVGGGRQWFSWIHREDLLRLILWAIQTTSIRGPVNGTSPQPVTNREFGVEIGDVLGRPSWLPMPRFALKLIMGDVADVICTGQRVMPRVALRAGFSYQYPSPHTALRDLLRRM